MSRTNNTTEPAIKPDELDFHRLGSGVDGVVFRCKYSGTDATLKRLCTHLGDDHYLVIKIPRAYIAGEVTPKLSAAIKAERDITNQIYSQNVTVAQGHSATLQPQENQTWVIWDDNQAINLNQSTPIIAMHLETYDGLYGNDLDNFLKKAKHNIGTQQQTIDPSGVQGAIAYDLPIILMQMMDSAHDGMRAMHEKGFLHRDIALRNCLVSRRDPEQDEALKFRAVLSDFGRTKQVSGNPAPNLNKVSDPEKYSYTRDPDESMPVKWCNESSLKYRKSTVRHDLYAFRIMLLEAMAALTQEPSNTFKRIVYDKEGLSSNPAAIDQFVRKHGDNVALAQYVAHAKDALADFPDAKRFLDCFKGYFDLDMTTITPEMDKNKFKECLNNFVQEAIMAKYLDYKNELIAVDGFLISARRLQEFGGDKLTPDTRALLNNYYKLVDPSPIQEQQYASTQPDGSMIDTTTQHEYDTIPHPYDSVPEVPHEPDQNPYDSVPEISHEPNQNPYDSVPETPREPDQNPYDSVPPVPTTQPAVTYMSSTAKMAQTLGKPVQPNAKSAHLNQEPKDAVENKPPLTRTPPMARQTGPSAGEEQATHPPSTRKR